ncbi:hypothetical protein Lalb_Chr00c03g0404241 [Lupinus albus]|uniref:Uncharacterized protein n=1 Tax=Lupinus albus TaxID=3870 RepID=A0A6A4NCR9_LUPAL|nr:hypothetical protein Lalb_Chr00c03g0404241 [Lupinus albus]
MVFRSVTHTKSVDCLLLNHAESLQDLYLILSIVLQLIEDFASVVRDAATRNLAMLLPIFPNVDKYFKVEELTFQLICDPSGVVLESTLKELVPAVIKWGNNLGHVLKHCPPLSRVEGCIESHLRVLGA